jgi:hypothetical protein
MYSGILISFMCDAGAMFSILIKLCLYTHSWPIRNQNEQLSSEALIRGSHQRGQADTVRG